MLLAQTNEEPRRVIDFYGIADTLVPMDQVVFVLTVKSSHIDLDSARILNDQKLDELMALTKKMKIKNDDVSMDQMDLSPDYLKRGREGTDFNPRAFQSGSSQPELTEYHARRNLAITLRDLTKYTEFLAGILKLDIELAGSPQYQVSNTEKIRKELTLKAIREAKRQAEALAGEMGMKISDPVYIGEVYWDGGESSYSQYGRYGGGGYGEEGTRRSQLTPDQLKLRASVNVTFQMEAM